MEKTRGKIKYCFIILDILLSFGLIFLAYQEYQKRDENLKKKEDINEEYRVLMNDETIGEKEVQDINNKIDELKNIDNTTKDQMKKVFELASQVEKRIQNKQTKYKIAYLTFDDGPYYNTYKVLSILKQYGVKATFFTTNINKEKCFDNRNANCHELYKEYAKANHTIANHTYTHGWNKGLYRSVDTFMDAIKKQEELIKSKTGIVTNIARFPGGSSTPGKTKGAAMKKALNQNGYGWVDWTAQDGDGGSLNDRATGWRKFTSSIDNPIEVVLFHDYNKVTTNMLPDVIKYLQERNYILLPLFYESVMINK